MCRVGGTGVGYAGVAILGRSSGRKQGAGNFEAMTLSFAVGTLYLLPVALVDGLLPSADLLLWTTSVAYLGLVPTAVAYTLFFAGLTGIRVTTASVVTLVEPVTAAVIGP